MSVEIEFDLLPEHVGNAQATAYLDAKIEEVRQMVINRPRPPVTRDLYRYPVQQWLRRFMCRYGKVLGNIEALGNFGVITQQQAKDMEQRLKFLIQFHAGTVMIGR